MNHTATASAAGSFRAFAARSSSWKTSRPRSMSADQKSWKPYWTVGPSSSGHSVDDRSSEIASSIVAVAMPRPA